MEKKKIQHQYGVSRCSYGVCKIRLRLHKTHAGSATIHADGAMNAHDEATIRYGATRFKPIVPQQHQDLLRMRTI